MDLSTQILIIILSVTLTVFLVVAIILGIYLIKLSIEIRKVAKSAQSTVDHIESAASGVAKMVSPLFIADILGRFMKKFMNKKEGKK